MMFLGKIIGNNISKISSEYPFIEFIEYVEDIKIDDYLTKTLIIGKKNAELIFGKEKIKVLNKNIVGNIFWTYSKIERRNEYENDIKIFITTLMKDIINTHKYYNYNIFIEPLNKTKSFIRFNENSKQKYYYLNKNQLYIYSPFESKNIIGLSLDDCEYAGINKNKILNKIKNNKYNIIIEETENDHYFNTLKMAFTNNNFIIPYLYFLSKT